MPQPTDFYEYMRSHMPEPETKSYTLGAERAAREALCNLAQVGCDDLLRFSEDDEPGEIVAEYAEIISRQTHDAEMLEALTALLSIVEPRSPIYSNPDFKEWTTRAKAIIAKVEGQ